MRISLFKLRAPKRFSYKPRHYDPALEDLHGRIKVIEDELNAQDELASGTANEQEMARAKIRSSWKTTRKKAQSGRGSNTKVFIIAAFLFVIFYVYFFTNLIP